MSDLVQMFFNGLLLGILIGTYAEEWQNAALGRHQK